MDNNKKKKYKPLETGDVITIEVNHKKYKTAIDEEGTQRFKANSVLRHLLDTNQIDLNKLAVDFQKGKFTKEDFAEFNMMLGYSVCGFAELSYFEDYEIKNPLWDRG